MSIGEHEWMAMGEVMNTVHAQIISKWRHARNLTIEYAEKMWTYYLNSISRNGPII